MSIGVKICISFILVLSIFIIAMKPFGNKSSCSEIQYFGTSTPLNKIELPLSYNIKKMHESSNEDIGLADILVINLDKDKERLVHLFAECKEEGLHAVKTGNCCDGKLSNLFNNKFKHNKLKIGERKCFLSHEMCWKVASRQTLPSLILEDDATLPFNIKPILAKITKDIKSIIDSGIGPKAIVVRLGLALNRNVDRTITPFGKTCLGTSGFHTGTWAYIVTPEAARTLLNITKDGGIFTPCDIFLNPPADRDSYCEHEQDPRIPPQNEYMFLEANPDFFELSPRYILPTDKGRIEIIKELSTSLNMSRSSVNY
jgi:GR25 family glycosyltransferase involved in LPS biosynthesis